MAMADPMSQLGVHLTDAGGTIRVWSAHATSIEVRVFASDDSAHETARVPLTRDEHHVWTADSPTLRPGAGYTLHVAGPEGPTHAFDPARALLDPYARGVARNDDGTWRGVVIDDSFDWGGTPKPNRPLGETVIYEAHLAGLTRLNAELPEEIRGRFAGLAHPTTLSYLTSLGVTAVELLPVHQFVSEQRLLSMGLSNYWGYNTLNFFAPHAAYASTEAQQAGPSAVVREFKTMVKALHEAGLEVILDVVYNHTAEEGPHGPTSSFRGIDNASYYRQDAHGTYIDTTGCGNALDFSREVTQRLVLDSLRYWAHDMQVDGFRFDLAATLGRDANIEFQREHPLLRAVVDDPQLADVKKISEPWDVGMGGWQVGNFPDGWSEWNDGFRDRMRNFWLRDIAADRATGTASEGIGSLARRLAGSNHVFSLERGPLASVNFITAHDGFTARDLVSYDRKHNLGNGELGRDGTNDNRSFNHGVEGPTDDDEVRATRRKAVRNLLGTLLLSAGVPMLTAGDEFGRTQRGNNNAYCHDSPLTWLSWDRDDWQKDLLEVVRTLIRLRRENPALRPERYGRWGETVPDATQMDWYNKAGETMSIDDWDSPDQRTLQYLAATTPGSEAVNRILLVVHGLESHVDVTLPAHDGVEHYTLLWDSGHDDITGIAGDFQPGATLTMAPTSMLLFRAS